ARPSGGARSTTGVIPEGVGRGTAGGKRGERQTSSPASLAGRRDPNPNASKNPRGPHKVVRRPKKRADDHRTTRRMGPRSFTSPSMEAGRECQQKSSHLPGHAGRPAAQNRAGNLNPGRNPSGGLTNALARPMFWSVSLLPFRYRVPRQRQTTRKGGAQNHRPHRGRH